MAKIKIDKPERHIYECPECGEAVGLGQGYCQACGEPLEWIED